jgi:hypothetical protein
VCTGHGRITGIERHCPDDGCGHTNGCPSNADTCNDLAGTYHIDEDENRVAVLIDRGDPEGAENYVGGWVGEDGVSQAGAAADSSTTSTYLVLRSQRTGIQIAIRHLVHDACNF